MDNYFKRHISSTNTLNTNHISMQYQLSSIYAIKNIVQTSTVHSQLATITIILSCATYTFTVMTSERHWVNVKKQLLIDYRSAKAE